MRAIRAIAGTAALVMALMGTSATGALAAGGKAKGYITAPNQGTLSFHASEPSGGGFEITNAPAPLGNIVGNVACYRQNPSTGGTIKTTDAVFVGLITKGPQKGNYVTVYLEDVSPGDATTGDTFTVARGGDPNHCPVPLDLAPVAGSGYIDIR